MKKNVITVLSLLMAASLVGCSGQGNATSSSVIDAGTSETSEPESSSEAPKTPLAAPTNFGVTRNDAGKWVVSFDSVEHANTYALLVKVGDAEFFKNANVTSGVEIDPGEDAGTYAFALTASDSTGAYLDSESASYTIAVELYADKDVDGVKMTGRIENEVPVGSFHYVYSDNSTYDGTVTSDFKRLKGKLQYTNNMYYEGDWANDNFEGDGMFTWSTTGNWKEGNTYQGKFAGGNYNDQIGTYYTAANWTRPVDYSGLLNWTGKMGSEFGCPGKNGETGKGEYSFANDSIYNGDLLKTNDKWDIVRQGWGINTWTVDAAPTWITGGDASYTIDNFEGTFDCVTSGHWIFGDGTWYFKKDGKPYGYVKGNWNGGTRLGAATKDLTVQDAYKDAVDLTPAA